MSAVSSFAAPERPRVRLSLWPLAVVAGLALAALAAFHWSHPGLRGRLVAAAAELRALPPDTPKAKVARAVARAFPGQDVRVEPGRFPDLVLVTVGGLDRGVCLAAERDAQRIEGLVVIELAGYRDAADCRARNDMTWRIMP